MAVLPAEVIDELWRDLMSQPPPGQPTGVTKQTLKDLVTACDQMLNDNAANLNQQVQAINPAWNTLSQTWRAHITSATLLRRYDKGY